MWAAYTGTTEMAELLIDAGADPNLGRNPPLHYAARFGRASMVQVLLARGADPMLPDAESKTALEQVGVSPLTTPSPKQGEKRVLEAEGAANDFLVRTRHRRKAGALHVQKNGP